MTQAVILAAGLGSRLRPLTDDRPKALVSLGGAPIIGHALDALAEAGITSVVVVTGYRQERIAAYLARRFDVRITTTENAAYASTNTLASLLAAAPLIEDDVLLLDGDLVLEPAVICRLDEPGTRLAVDCGRRLDDEAVKVALADERIVAVGKQLPPGLVAAGESIGLARIDRELGRRLFTIGPRVLETRGPNAYYEAAFQALIDEGARLDAVDITGLRWVEIDDLEDLRRAQALFVAA